MAFTCVIACDNTKNNEPVCDSSNVGQSFRNFFDPTAYWYCSAAGQPAENRRCPIGNNMYDSATQQCVSSDNWVWTPNCPDEESQ